MADVVLNGQTYSNVEEVLLPNGEGAYVVFSEGEGGDMRMEDYDADGAVKEAGGIAEYVKANGGSSTGGNSGTVPTKLSELEQDAEHRTVTDVEKESWSAKSNFSGDYNDLVNKPSSVGGGSGINPNLLDNWYFANPVNQKGQTEYTEAGYTVDRWRRSSGAAEYGMTVGDGFITIASGSPGTVLDQLLENPELYEGKQVTASVLLANGTFASGTVVVPAIPTTNSYPTSTAISISNLKFHIQAQVNKTIRARMEVPVNTTADIVAVKLELGDTQTLAHQDADGNWVLNEIPNYGERLARCQRYFLALRGDNTDAYVDFGMGYSRDSMSAMIYVPLPVQMRVKPAVVTKGLFQISQSGGKANETVNSIEIGTNYSATSVGLIANVTSGLTQGNVAVLQSYNNSESDIWLDANL